MACATVGELRAYLDGELPGDEMSRLAQHIASCVSCEAEVRGLRVNASVARSALDTMVPTALEAAVPSWSRVRDRLDGRTTHPVTRGLGVFDMIGNLLGQAVRGRMRLVTTVVVVFVAMTFLFSLAPVQTAASSFLSVFRVKQFVAVTVDPSSLPNLASPSELGTFKQVGDHSMKQVTLAQAESAAGFKMQMPTTFPSGIESSPRATTLMGASSVTFTPDLKKVRAYLAGIGASNVKLPDNLDGAPITLQTQPAVAVLYTEKGGYEQQAGSIPKPLAGQKFLYVGATTSPTVNVPDGIDVNQVRAELLKVPGLPTDLVNQLKSIDDWTNTVVVPVVKGTSKNVTVQGVQGVLVQEDKGPGLSLFWLKDGVVYTVSSNVSEGELLSAANSMK